jgi:hypothetical protein
MKKLKIAHFINGGYEFKEIDNTLDKMHELVGGYIQIVFIAKDLVLVCDDEGKLKENAVPSLMLVTNTLTDPILNPCFIVSIRGEDFASLTNKQIEWIKKRTFKVDDFCCIKV